MIMKVLWITIGSVLLSAILAWGAWSTVTVTRQTPRTIFDQHVKDDNLRFERMQNRIEDKLDKIKEHLMEDHN